MEAIGPFIANNIPIHMFFAFQILFAEFMFFIDQKRRSNFWVRVSITTVLYFLICYFHPDMGNVFIRVLCMFLWSLALCSFCLACEFNKTIFICLVAYAIQNLAYNLGDLVTRLFGLYGTGSTLFYLVSSLVFIAVYVGAYFLIVRRYSKSKHFHLKSKTCYALAVVTIIVVFSKNFISKFGWLDDKELLAMFTAISCFLVLALQFMSVKNSNIEEENKMIEKLLVQEKNRQEKMKETMDIINMKCHDLRYFIREKGKTNNMDESFIKEVQDNINFYDRAPETGNGSLNVVLSEKLLLCAANNIDISYIIDSTIVETMEQSDVYSLFENALDNAIEASKQEDEEKRMISINMQKQNETGKIIIYNYCSKEIKFGGDGIPKSQKDNTFHGFGTKSIRYIVEKYDGSVIFDYKDNIFTISIMIPLKKYQEIPVEVF